MTGSPTLIVFDLDGTLVDSLRDLTDSANTLVVERGGRPLDAERVATMIGSGARVLVARALEAADCGPMTDGALARFLSIYERRILDHTRPYEGVPELLAALRQAGHRLAILTNKPRLATLRLLGGLQMADDFFDVVGGDGPDERKPDPRGLRRLMAEVGARPETTILVGDSLVDLETAGNAGVRFCLARYGFGASGVHPQARRTRDLSIDAPLELLELVREFRDPQPS